jgi:anti-anti-sigma factor
MAMTLKKTLPTDLAAFGPDAIPGLSDASPLQVFVRNEEDPTQVIVAGELDGSTARFLREKLAEVTADLDGALVLDVSLLTFIDSTGLSLLLSVHKNLQTRGLDLTIVDPTPMTRRLFQITGLNQVLRIEPSEQRS